MENWCKIRNYNYPFAPDEFVFQTILFNNVQFREINCNSRKLIPKMRSYFERVFAVFQKNTLAARVFFAGCQKRGKVRQNR